MRRKATKSSSRYINDTDVRRDQPSQNLHTKDLQSDLEQQNVDEAPKRAQDTSTWMMIMMKHLRRKAASNKNRTVEDD
jgi:hypothetical protein